MMPTDWDIAIIGAGAAGLATAIAAAERAPDARITLFDSAKTIGAKILVAGGGRCNVTHDVIQVDDYHGNRNIVRNVFKQFDQPTTVAWFESLGVTLKREPTGKLFPITDRARTVLDALLNRIDALGVTLHPGRRLNRVERAESPGSTEAGNAHFLLHFDAQPAHTARRLVLATGGQSLPRTGSDGHGWRIVRSLGHTVTEAHAALVPLCLDDAFWHEELSGLSHEGALTTTVNGKRVDQRTGSLLWTHFGISGPLAMDGSRFWTIAHDTKRDVRVHLNFLPALPPAEVEPALQALNRETIRGWLNERLPQRLVDRLLREAGIAPPTRGCELPKAARRQLTDMLTHLALPVVAHRGWNHAEVTAGGVPLKEIDHRSMASRCCDGLYLVGEILDCDGRIGGFNFQWAWSTGHIAGRALTARS